MAKPAVLKEPVAGWAAAAAGGAIPPYVMTTTTSGSTVNYIPSLGNTTSYNASVLTGGTS